MGQGDVAPSSTPSPGPIIGGAAPGIQTGANLSRSIGPEAGGLRFIDLFAGLGGFHLALRRLGHRAVFASEINPGLRALYEKNFGLRPAGDIREIAPADVPSHEILCAGFPCQPFSKAGDQQGFAHPQWGDLIDYVLGIVRHHTPAYVLLENVPNLQKHNGGQTWERIELALKTAGYNVRHERLSPHLFGIPQIRDRMYIVASRFSLDNFSWPEPRNGSTGSIKSILEQNPDEARPIPEQVERCLETWQTFIQTFPKDEAIPSFPIWSTEFGATYPYENTTPSRMGVYRLRPYRGSHGKPLAETRARERMSAMPSYARAADDAFPAWKIGFIRANRALYRRHHRWIDQWLPRILEFPPSLQKLEWNAKGEERDIWKYVIQFRASGVRVKRPTTAPSLIAMTATQVPIIGWEKRYMTPRECASLQSMDELKHLPSALTPAYEALGNAVNVHVVEMVAHALLTAVRSAPGGHTHRPHIAPGNGHIV